MAKCDWWWFSFFLFSFSSSVFFSHLTGAVSVDPLKNVLLLCRLVVVQFCSCWDKEPHFHFLKYQIPNFAIWSVLCDQNRKLSWTSKLFYTWWIIVQQMSLNGEQPCFLCSEDSKCVNPERVEVWRLTGIHTVAFEAHIWLQTRVTLKIRSDCSHS